jgi:hypothetical protein
MSDPHPPRDDHGPAATPSAPAQPPVVTYVTPAPVWPQPPYPAAPPVYAAPSVFPSAHCCCAGATPSILQPCQGAGGFMVCCRVCGLAKDEKDGHKDDKPHKEPPPEFTDATPEEFRARFKDVWQAVEDSRIPAGIIADCHALLLLLLRGLDGVVVTKSGKKSSGGGLFRSQPASPTEPLERLKALQKEGLLLKSVVKAAEGIRLDPGDLDMAPLGDPERARRYMHLIWQIADQGYEQVRWSERCQSPPRAKAPEPEAHGSDGGHGGGHGH